MAKLPLHYVHPHAILSELIGMEVSKAVHVDPLADGGTQGSPLDHRADIPWMKRVSLA